MEFGKEYSRRFLADKASLNWPLPEVTVLKVYGICSVLKNISTLSFCDKMCTALLLAPLFPFSSWQFRCGSLRSSYEKPVGS